MQRSEILLRTLFPICNHSVSSWPLPIMENFLTTWVLRKNLVFSFTLFPFLPFSVSQNQFAPDLHISETSDGVWQRRRHKHKANIKMQWTLKGEHTYLGAEVRNNKMDKEHLKWALKTDHIWWVKKERG